MVVFPNAKINIGLNVVEKRPDGYHNIETIFYPISLCDALDVVESDRFGITVSGIEIGGNPENNLAAKAYLLFKDEFRLPPVKIHLHKAIPVGAGLGGGSSDGAFMLKLLAKLFGLNLNTNQLEESASKLGADCPFFIKNQPAFATGTGNILTQTKIDLANCSIILVKPPFSVITAEAYKNVAPFSTTQNLLDISGLPVVEWKGKIKNDLEPPVSEKYPEINSIKEKLYRMGALFASMSGSGSSVYGIFSTLPKKLRANFPNDYFIYY
jgi:4-diphosphocytidyl-2-C-methyl-D-erythritol kinase